MAESETAASVFTFRNVSFVVPVKNGGPTKTILNKISGSVTSGHVLAIMGPSGAGKTTLINVLTLNAFGGTSLGAATLNGKILTPKYFADHCYVVTQQDNHWAFLTCRETLIYAAQLYMGLGVESVSPFVDALIKKMGLESCKDTLCGNQFMQGLSGGQKRRLSIAIALIKKPTLIFLDEPTSGLDAAAAANIMVEITALAASDDLLIIATIHQPSTKVYQGFDQVMLLSGGREAYMGKAAEAAAYFESIGWPMPRNTNPAEFFLDLVNSDFIPQEDVGKIIDAWAIRRPGIHDAEVGLKLKASEEKPKIERSLSHEIVIMLSRHALLIRRDPVLYIGRALIFLLSNVYFAFVYFSARDSEQDQIFNQMWLIVWYIAVAANMGVVAVFAFNEEYKSVHKEIKNGMTSPLSYIVSKSLLEVPIMFIFAMFALGVPAYGISDFYAPQFFQYVIIWAISIYSWECLAQILSLVFENPLLGMMLYMGCWFSGFLYCGLLIPYEDLKWPLKLFYYIFPLKYNVRAMVYTEFINKKFPRCKEGDVICFGEEGADILDSIGNVYEVISSKDTISEDIGVLLAFAVVCKLGYAILIRVKSRRVSKFDGLLEK